MKTKVCRKCGIEKPLSEFHKDKRATDGLYSSCKECHRKCSKEWKKDNPEYIRRYRQEHREDNSKYQKEYNQRPGVKEYHKEYERKYEKNRRANDPKYKLNCNMATVIWFALKKNKAGRRWEDLVGYSLQDLMARLSVNFQKGMSFENYGKWQVDHRKPQSLFNFATADDPDFKLCWALANLQPLWARENITKSNKF